jgi:hypothetical protein
MKRGEWLLAVLLCAANVGLTAEQAQQPKTNTPPARGSSAGDNKAISCTLPKNAQVGKQISLTCTNVPSETTVEVALKGANGQSPDSPPATVNDKTVTFTPPNAGTYSVSLKVNNKSIDVPGQLEVQAPASVSCDKLPNVAPEQVLTLTSCSGLNEQDGTILLKNPEAKDLTAPGQVDSKNKTLTFQVPSEAKGVYSLTAGGRPIDSQLNVMEPVEVTGIYPGTTYQGQKGFDFKIAGKNFSDARPAEAGEPPTGNLIEIVGGGMFRKCKTETPPAGQYPCATDISSTTNEIKVEGFTPKHYYGPVTVVVHVGKSASKPMTVTFAQVSQPGVVLAAAAVFFIVAYILYRLVTKGIKGEIVNGVQLTPWSSLFLDRETNSYSLSKFQVIAWTAVTVYSYVYIFLCRTLIQGNFKFPDVPQNLPQLFFVSAGTTVAAAAITATVGSKGAGPIKPSAGDFISTGGLVAGDRFQFFTWTIVGCLGYLYLVIRMNPEMADISLPNVPDNFLYLMGVSSAGYLGGKLVRKPGPVIKVLSVTTIAKDQTRGTNTLTINLKGENLDPKAQVKVDNAPLRGDLFQITPPREPDPQTHFCDEVNVSLYDADKYIEGTHELTLVNQDGQGATVGFPADPMTFDPIFVPATDKRVDVQVTGKNFADGTTFEWKNPADTKAKATKPTESGAAALKTPTLLIVNLTPGTVAGVGKLTFISPIKLRATTDVTVTEAGPAPSTPGGTGTQTGPTSSTASGAGAQGSMTIDPIPDQKTGTDPVEIKVTGKNFVEETKFEWRNPANAQQPSTSGDATVKSMTELTVKLAPGPVGTGKLTLIDPTGLQESADVNVT